MQVQNVLKISLPLTVFKINKIFNFFHNPIAVTQLAIAIDIPNL